MVSGVDLPRRAVGVVGTLAGPLLLRLQRRRDEALVLLYHRVAPTTDDAYPPLHPDELAAHLALMQRHHDIVPLTAIVDALEAGERLTGRCAITFDDGYRDFLDHAYPVLAKHRVPVTHYLVSDSVRTGRPNWNYRLNRILVARGDADARTRHVEKERVARLDGDERVAWLEREEARLAIDDRGMMLGADDLARCDPALVDWQSHSVTHASVGTLDADALGLELEGSRRAIEAWTSRPVHSFSFPNGETSAIAGDAVRAAGYRSAVVVGERAVRGGTPLIGIPRFDVGRHAAAWFPLVVSGALGQLRRIRP